MAAEKQGQRTLGIVLILLTAYYLQNTNNESIYQLASILEMNIWYLI